MRFAGRVVGSLRVVPDRQRSWPKSLLRRLEALAALAAAAEWALSHEAARAASGSPEGDLARDPVTGLHVSAAFDAFLPQELALARAQGEPLSLMFLEFDPIASIRRRDGSEFADAALGIAARAVLGTLRPSDFVARCEGDRVAAVLPGSDKVDATRLAELVRRAVAEAGIASAVPAALTASIGLASRPDDGTDAPTLRSSAEFALARARELGGDRVAGGVDLSGSRSGSRLRPPRATG
jgi:diguanylate cyclase (GGDEF)-like protein